MNYDGPLKCEHPVSVTLYYQVQQKKHRCYKDSNNMYDLKFITVWLISILPVQEPEAEDHTSKPIKWVQEQPRQPIETLTQEVQRELGREFSNRALGLACTQPR